jgi:hypothetical protein
VVGANKKFEKDEVAALNALIPGAMKLPDGEIEELALAASLRLGQESKQLSLPIVLRKTARRLIVGKTYWRTPRGPLPLKLLLPPGPTRLRRRSAMMGCNG